MAVAWLIHIVIYNMTGVHIFLNALFIELDKFFSLFGVLAYAGFTFYLLWACVKGVMKVCFGRLPHVTPKSGCR